MAQSTPRPLTIRDIGQTLALRDPDFRQGYNSVGTLIQRLIKKGYVAKDSESGTASLFRACLPLDFATRQQIESFLDSYLLTSPKDLRVVIEIALDRLAGTQA